MIKSTSVFVAKAANDSVDVDVQSSGQPSKLQVNLKVTGTPDLTFTVSGIDGYGNVLELDTQEVTDVLDEVITINATFVKLRLAITDYVSGALTASVDAIL